MILRHTLVITAKSVDRKYTVVVLSVIERYIDSIILDRATAQHLCSVQVKYGLRSNYVTKMYIVNYITL